MDLFTIFLVSMRSIPGRSQASPRLQLDSDADIVFDPLVAGSNAVDFQCTQHLFTQVASGSHTIKLKLSRNSGERMRLERGAADCERVSIMAEWTIPPTWVPGQLVSSLDMQDYGQGNHQHLYDNYLHADAPVSFSKSGRTADNTSQERKSLGTMTLESKGNDILFVSSAEYKVGRLRTTTRGTRTTYTTGGITTTDVQLPDRVERVRTGTRLNRHGEDFSKILSTWLGAAL